MARLAASASLCARSATARDRSAATCETWDASSSPGERGALDERRQLGRRPLTRREVDHADRAEHRARRRREPRGRVRAHPIRRPPRLSRVSGWIRGVLDRDRTGVVEIRLTVRGVDVDRAVPHSNRPRHRPSRTRVYRHTTATGICSASVTRLICAIVAPGRHGREMRDSVERAYRRRVAVLDESGIRDELDAGGIAHATPARRLFGSAPAAWSPLSEGCECRAMSRKHGEIGRIFSRGRFGQALSGSPDREARWFVATRSSSH